MPPGTEGILLLWLVAVHRAWGQTCDLALLEDGTSRTAPDYARQGERETYAEGENATYVCARGYVHHGDPPDRRVATCRNGTWRNVDSSLRCLPKNCGSPGTVAHGRTDGNLFTFPNAVTFECDAGYRLLGAAKLYCQSDGKWLPDVPPTCQKVFCAPLKSPSNGKVHADDRSYGAVARYECNAGFRLSGAVERHCLGTWNGTEPSCKELVCDVLHRPEHGQAILLSRDYKPGSAVLYKCDHDETKYTVRCLHGGVWSGDPPVCPAPPTTTTAATTTARNSQGAEIGAACDPLEKPRNGKAFGGDDRSVNASVIFSCDEGYVMRGPSNATCRPGGVWEPPRPPTCESPFPWVPVVAALAGFIFLGTVIAAACALRRRRRGRPSARGYRRQTRKPSASDVFARSEVAHLHKPYPVTSL